MKKPILLLFLFVLLISGKAQVLEQDSLALVAFYNSTNGPGWYSHTNWLSPGKPVRTWNGVKVIGNRVVRLDLGSNKLMGHIPEEFGLLDSLSYLNLSADTILSLPQSFGNLITLDTLGFFASTIDSLPDSFSNLTDLKVFDFSFTQIRYLPEQFGNLTQLKELNGYDADLHTLPASIGNIIGLQNIYLSLNKISNFPPEICNCTNLKRLHLNANRIPEMPEEIGNLTQLTELILGRNELTELPAGIFTLTGLKTLNFAANQLTQIPPAIGNLTNMENFQFFENQFTSIPAEIGNCVKLNYINGYSNKLDELPLSLLHLPNIGTLFLAMNALTFEDIEPLISIPGFEYYLQDSIGRSLDTAMALGSSFHLEIVTGGTHNQYQWFKNNELVSGATNPYLDFEILMFADSGSYHCEVTNTVATELTLISKPTFLQIVDNLGISNSEIDADIQITIFPNPASDLVRVSFPESKTQQDTELVIYNLNGQLVLNSRINATNLIEIDISGITSGVYFVQLLNNEKNALSKPEKLVVL